MKLYRIIRRYGKVNSILEMVFADNEDEVYDLLEWGLGDTPVLEITEITPKKGCFISVHTKNI